MGSWRKKASSAAKKLRTASRIMLISIARTVQLRNVKNSYLSTSKNELIDLLKAWVAISIAFAIVLTGLRFNADFFIGIAVAAITVGVGFLLHELAHKILAQRYGCFAEFRSFDTMLLLAIVLSFLGFIFAAPGAVMITGQVTRRENGLISVVGPWTNLALALAFLGLNVPVPALSLVWTFGFQINTWLALFNMIPVWLLDGRKVWMWNKGVWGATVAAAVGLMWVQSPILFNDKDVQTFLVTITLFLIVYLIVKAIRKKIHDQRSTERD